jgi:hypothetical protein
MAIGYDDARGSGRSDPGFLDSRHPDQESTRVKPFSPMISPLVSELTKS